MMNEEPLLRDDTPPNGICSTVQMQHFDTRFKCGFLRLKSKRLRQYASVSWLWLESTDDAFLHRNLFELEHSHDFHVVLVRAATRQS